MTVADAVSEAPDVSELLREGEALSRSRDYAEALDRFNRAIAMDPSSSMAWYNRGVLLEGQRDAKGAKQSFTICLDLDPDHAPATANLAVLLERMGDTDGAGAMATRALTHYPDHPELLDIRRRCLSGQSIQPDLPAERPTPTATWEDEHLTKAMDKAGVSDAQAVLEESTHHDTDGDGRLDQDELERAASVVAAQQQVQDAMVEEEPMPEPSTEPEPAPPETAESPSETPLSDVVQQARDELDAGHPKAAIGLLRDRLRTDGAENIDAWLTAATAMHRLNLEDHALGAAQHSLRIDDQRHEAWSLVGDVHAAKGEHQAAIDAYTNAIEFGASDDVNNRRWVLLTKDGHPDLWYEEAMSKLGPDADLEDRMALASWMLHLGEGEVTALEHLPDQPPTLPEAPEIGSRVLLLLANDAPRLRARAHSLQLQHLEAIGLWKAEVTKDATDGSAWTGMAKALEAAGELEKAAKCHERARQTSGEHSNESPAPAPAAVNPAPEPVVTEVPTPAPAFELPHENEPEPVDLAASLLMPVEAPSMPAEVQAQNVEVDLAAAALEATSNIAAPARTTTPEQDAQQGREWFNRGTQLLEDKKFREALSCFDKSLSLLSDDEEKVILVLNARGNCYYYMEDYPKCVDAYYQAMMIRPAQVRGQTLYNMGVAYAEMERYSDAIKCFEQGESRGLTQEEVALAKEQIRRCKILRKEQEKRQSKRR